jgi:hypothetical protein
MMVDGGWWLMNDGGEELAKTPAERKKGRTY